MASKLTSFCLTSIFILVTVGITSGALSISRSDHTRAKRATGDQFNNGHVMSQKTYNNLLNSKPGTMGSNMDNYFGYVDRHDPRPRPIPPSQTYSNRKTHTFIVGSREGVQNAVRNGQQLPPQGRHTQVTNLRETQQPHTLVDVQRNNAGQISIISETNRHFAGATVNKNAVHYQANYQGGVYGHHNPFGMANPIKISTPASRNLYQLNTPAPMPAPKGFGFGRGGGGRRGRG